MSVLPSKEKTIYSYKTFLRSLFPGFVVFFMLAIMAGCSKNTKKLFRKKSLQQSGLTYSLVMKHDFDIKFSQPGLVDTILLKYLGAGGYFIEHGSSAIIIDPFFSPYGMIRLGLFNIKTKIDNVHKGLADISQDVRDKVHSIFITHAHYDHLLDAPYVFNHYMDSSMNGNKIYGNSSVKTRAGQVVREGEVEDITSKVCTPDLPGKWISLDHGRMRVMPIRTRHAPHLKRPFPVSLYRGEAKPIRRYRTDTSSTHVTRWKGGCTFGYLIDFLDQDSIIFRIYLLTSASSPPDGFVPSSILRQHEVNLAIIGAASALNVKDYPEGIIQLFEPQKIILAHWEDLFKPYLVKDPSLIRATNFKKLLPRINKVFPWTSQGNQNVFMPEPGVKIRLIPGPSG